MKSPRLSLPSVVTFSCLFSIACGSPPPTDSARADNTFGSDAIVEGGRVADRAGQRPKVLILGDSLTAGLGLETGESYPAQLQQLSDHAGYTVEIVPHGVSGDTTAGGLSRLEWVIAGQGEQDNVVSVIVALGGNDGLRGLPVEQMFANLDAILSRLLSEKISVLLAGMEAPPNYGNEYTSRFRAVFRELADKYDVVYLPFLLEGVAGDLALNQRDGIHPNAAGARRVAEHLWPALEGLFEQLSDDSEVVSLRQ
jgi:acyl-CoA thioesterase-1